MVCSYHETLFSNKKEYALFCWPCYTACGILVPQTGLKPTAPALEGEVLNHWATREVPEINLFLIIFFLVVIYNVLVSGIQQNELIYIYIYI